MRNRAWLIWVGLILLIIPIVWTTARQTSYVPPTPTTNFVAQAAQPVPGTTMSGIIESLNNNGTLFTLAFNGDVPRLGGSVDVNAGDALQINRVGSDVVCFDVRNNNNTQITCVPFSKVSALFYGE